MYFTTSFFISSVLSGLTQLTLAVFGLNNLHLLQTFEHAPQVGDAVLKSNFLVLTGMGIFKQLPHVNLWFLFLRLLPVGQIVVGSLRMQGENVHKKMNIGESVKMVKMHVSFRYVSKEMPGTEVVPVEGRQGQLGLLCYFAKKLTFSAF